MSQSEEKKPESGPEDSSTSEAKKDGAKALLRRVVVEGAPEKPAGGAAADAPTVSLEVDVPPEVADEAPKKPKKKTAAEKRKERIEAEIEKIIEAGSYKAKYVPDPLLIKPMGPFVEVVSTAFAALMEKAETPPIDHFQTQVRDEHPDWHPDRVAGVAVQRYVGERGRLAVIAAAKVSAESNLMYELAGLAVAQDRAWAEEHLLPGEAMRITRAAIIIGEVRDYLGESLSILGTEVVEEDEEEDEATASTPAPSGAGSAEPSSDSTASGPEDSMS